MQSRCFRRVSHRGKVARTVGKLAVLARTASPQDSGCCDGISPQGRDTAR